MKKKRIRVTLDKEGEENLQDELKEKRGCWKLKKEALTLQQAVKLS